MKGGDRIDPLLFLLWYDDQVERAARNHERVPGEQGSAQQEVFDLLGWSSYEAATRRIYRWRMEGAWPLRDEIVDALDQAGVDAGDVYPELALVERWRFCPSCDTDVVSDAKLACPLCDGPTTSSVVCPSCGGRKTRQAQVCIACVPRDSNGYHTSVLPLTDKCQCGGQKTRYAQTCWRCFVSSGGQRGKRHRKNSLQCISPATLLRARELYDGGLSIRAVAREILPDTTYASDRSCANSLFDLFKARGWPLRNRVDATVLSNVARAFRPQCLHVFAAGSKKGQRCERRSLGETGYCWHHRPEQIAAALARVRAY